ncbi:MAG: 3-hydroxyacyl-CoA dehydrogenase family protein [Syntrophales bacterium]
MAEVEGIDRAWMRLSGMPIGPFGLMDRFGLDSAWKTRITGRHRRGNPGW